MSNPTFPSDQNGYPIAALAPQSNVDASLSGSFTEVLAADSQSHRVVELFAENDGVRVRTSTSDAVGYPLTAKLGKVMKLTAGVALQAKGSGTITVTVLG